MQVSQVLLGSALLLALLMALALPAAAAPADDVIVQKRQAIPDELQRIADPKRKRPFCNAFTGCGRKRADESLGSLVELNSEPAVAELSRQILSEAKLWEAIQEARAELQRRRHQQQLQSNQVESADGPLPLPLTGYRKRRAAPVPAPAAAAAAAGHGPAQPAQAASAAAGR